MPLLTKILTADTPDVTWSMSGPGSTVGGVSLVDHGDGTATFNWDTDVLTTRVDTTITFRATNNSTGAYSEVTEPLTSWHVPEIHQDIPTKGLTLTYETAAGPGATPQGLQNSIYIENNNPNGIIVERRLVARSINPTPSFAWTFSMQYGNIADVTTTVTTTDVTDDTLIIQVNGALYGADAPANVDFVADIATVTVIDQNNPYSADFGNQDLAATMNVYVVVGNSYPVNNF